MVDPLKRPEKPGRAKPNETGRQSNQDSSGKPKKVITVGANRDSGRNGGGNRRGGNGGEGDRPSPPSPWLIDPDFDPNPTASFVEYLRWMRALPFDPEEKERRKTQDANTKVQILQMAEESANYRDRLTTLTNRTKLIAGEENTFQVRCLWRIRVGGHRGPESILLPAFDALGMPYIPASTLRGVARTQAIREVMEQEGVSWRQAEEAISRQYFGYLDSKKSEERSGKVIFLDAYPLPQQSGDGGGLAVDMANSIWRWEGDTLDYSPNPNPFFSLEKATFLIGIRPTTNCDEAVLDKVKGWLSHGLSAGVGSQVNTGYGSLVEEGKSETEPEFLSVNFVLEGQLIHGRQKFKSLRQPYKPDRKGNLRADTEVEPEVRSIAFKSMLRYWFKALSLGLLPIQQVRQLESRLFGSIDAQFKARGWIKFRAIENDFFKATEDEPAQQVGTFRLYFSEGLLSDEQKASIRALFSALTWMSVRLGGAGQGARRPCYSRRENPRWRGSTFVINPNDSFWAVPETVQEFNSEFQDQLRAFRQALLDLLGLEGLPCQVASLNMPRTASRAEPHAWMDAVDSTCKIIVLKSSYEGQKPQALSLLHQMLHQLEEEAERLKSESRKLDDRRLSGKSKQKFSEAKSLCGGTNEDFIRGEKRKAIPSPIWIADLGDYQVVTVFGATQDPRQRYVNELRQRTDRNDYAQIFPFN